jgi:virginiamycin B lyase
LPRDLLKLILNRRIHPFLIISAALFLPSIIQPSASQLSSLSNPPNVNQQFVTYQKQSNFIHEFNLPASVDQRGLKGITTDYLGNPWFYDQTNKTSMIMKYNLANNTFSSYPVEGKTVTDNPVINLAGGQLIYDQKRNSIWFTDARINALGSFDTLSGKVALYRIPTNNSGIMGVILSPDNKTIWFTEIIGNKIGSFDIESKTITEFPTGDLTGPTLLAFDNNGELWVTLSYSNSILKIEPWLLIPGSKARGMSEVKLEKPDTFSPFGIVIAQNKDNISRIFLSDHGSSRVIVSNLTSELNNYTSYWTSPSQAYPASLPSQVVADKFGNIYFAQHGGNKISTISAVSGLMTEFDIPTGPLATVVYIAIAPDAKKVWFTEWASNRIAYLDAAVPVTLELRVKDPIPISLKVNQTHSIDTQVSKINTTANPLVSLNGIELSLVGMTDSGLQGLTYVAKPQRFNMTNISSIKGEIDLTVDAKEAIAGKYTTMPRISTLEKDGLTVSLLQPQRVTLDVPVHNAQLQNFSTAESNESSNSALVMLKDLAKYISVGVAITLIGYLIYRKISQRSLKRDNQNKPV